MTTTFIAGKDAALYDKSDWSSPQIPVYFNPANCPANVDEIETIIKHCCASWSLRYSHELKYAGRMNSRLPSYGIVIHYATTEQLLQMYGKEVNGLCKYHADLHNNTKWILSHCEIYINANNRPLADNYAHGTIMHELGHACGIHGHHEDYGNVMSVSSMGRYKLTLKDCQMLDSWNPYPVELHKDLGMSAPVVTLGDGQSRWMDLRYTGNGLVHSWTLASEQQWPAPASDNVTLGGVVEFYTQMCQVVQMKQVTGLDLNVRAEFVFAPNGTLILTYAE